MANPIFRMRCVKCQSTDIEITRVGGGWNRGGVPILKCRCGKQVFGEEAIEAEYRRQHAAWKEEQRRRRVPKKDRAQEMAAHLQQKRLREQVQQAHAEGLQLHTEIRALVAQLAIDSAPHPRGDELQRMQNLIHVDNLRLGELVRNLAKNTKDVASRGSQDLRRLLGLSHDHLEEMRRVVPGIRRRETRCQELLLAQPEPVKSAPVKSAPVEPTPVRPTPVRPTPVEPEPVEPVKAAPVEPEPQGHVCAWEECTNPAINNSKYCSRQCSNKNARSRARSRHQRRDNPVTPTSELKLADIPIGGHPEEQKFLKTLDAIVERAKPEPSNWDAFNLLTEAELRKQNLSPLRKYARHKLQIIGASKIPGGKPVLIAHILEARKRLAAA